MPRLPNTDSISSSSIHITRVSETFVKTYVMNVVCSKLVRNNDAFCAHNNAPGDITTIGLDGAAKIAKS